MLSGPRKIFCDGVVTGLTATDAYLAAFPRSSHGAARRSSSALLKNPEVKAEIQRMRAEAEKLAGSAVLTLLEKRKFLARVVRAAIARIPDDSDLWQAVRKTKCGTHYLLPCKLEAIRLDNDLAKQGGEAEHNDALAELLRSIIK